MSPPSRFAVDRCLSHKLPGRPVVMHGLSSVICAPQEQGVLVAGLRRGAAVLGFTHAS
jgi:hypothetical protein